MRQFASRLRLILTFACAVCGASSATDQYDRLRAWADALNIEKAPRPAKLQSAARTVVLFKFHALDPFALLTLSKLATEAPARGYKLVLLADADRLENETLSEIRATFCDGNTNEVFTFGADELWGRFERATAWQRSEKKAKLKYHNGEVPFFYWFLQQPAGRWDYVWGVEADVSFTGDWGDMLDGHQNITHDILANRVGWRPMLWSFGRALSFRDAVDGIGGSTLRPCRMAYGSKRLPCPEERRAGLFMPIIRYSDRVIEHLIKQYDDGKAGHCEIGQSTLCNMTAWCTMANISSAWMSHLFGSPGGGVSDFRLYHAMVEHHPNKLLHPTRQVGSGHFHTKVKGKDHLKEGSAHSDLERKVARVRRPPDWSTEIQKNTYRVRALCILKNTGDHEDYLGGRIAGPYGLPVDQQRICDHAYECRFGGGTRASNQITVCERRCHKFPQWCPEALWAGQGKVREGTMEWFPLQGGDGGGAYRGKRGQRGLYVYKRSIFDVWEVAVPAAEWGLPGDDTYNASLPARYEEERASGRCRTVTCPLVS